MNIKLRKKSLKTELVAFSLALATITTSFFNFSKNKINIPTIKINTSNTIGTKDDTATIPVEDKSFEEQITDIESNYNFNLSNLTIPDTSNYTNCNIENISHESTSIYNKATELIEQIKENSITYLENHSEFILAFLDNDTEHHSDKIATQTILKDTISDILKTGTNKDICLFNSLKCVISYNETLVSNDTYAKYYPEENLLIIFPNNVYSTIEKIGTNQWEALKYAIQCELNFIREQHCECQENNLEFPYTTLLESSIYSELYNLNKTNIAVDNNITKCESLILSLGLFNKNTTINDYYQAIFNNDIETFYNFCNINTYEDIYTLNKILYSMDILNEGNDINIGYDYKADIFKIYIKNLVKYTTENKDFTLKDNLIIYNILKNLILTDLDTSLTDDAITNIETLNNIYINFLSSHYNKPITKIEEMEASTEIINSITALIDTCNKNITLNSNLEYTSYNKKLIEKFPLLKQILANYEPTNYQSFNSTNITLTNYNKNNNKYILKKKKINK